MKNLAFSMRKWRRKFKTEILKILNLKLKYLDHDESEYCLEITELTIDMLKRRNN